MKTFLKTTRAWRFHGFTLVELMVVVAIIGVLAAIAIPNFRTYQAKAKTSEAKLSLSAVYTAQESFYGDYDQYAGCIGAMGYDIVTVATDNNYYGVGIEEAAGGAGAANTAVAGAGAAGCVNGLNVQQARKAVGGAIVVVNEPTLIAEFAAKQLQMAAAAPWNAYTVGAAGHIDRAKAAAGQGDTWTMDQDKNAINQRVGY